MPQLARTYSFSTITQCLIALSLLLNGQAAIANSSMGEEVATSREARSSASTYSFDQRGVGILMSYGTKNGVSADDVGSAFVKEINKRGYPARYFYYQTERDGMAMEFHVGYSAFGPWAPNVAASHMSEVVERVKVMRNILTERKAR